MSQVLLIAYSFSFIVCRPSIRNADKWAKETGATEVDWTHRLVIILDHLLRDTELTIRM